MAKVIERKGFAILLPATPVACQRCSLKRHVPGRASGGRGPNARIVLQNDNLDLANPLFEI